MAMPPYKMIRDNVGALCEKGSRSPAVSRRRTGPAADLAFRRFGIAVSWQIDEHQPPVEIEEVDLPGSTGGVGGSRERPASGQRVEEARLADVGPSGEGDLGQRMARQRAGLGRADNKPSVAGEKAASDLGEVRIYHPRRKYFRQYLGRGAQAAPWRCMIAHC